MMYNTQALHRSAQQHSDLRATIFADHAQSFEELIASGVPWCSTWKDRT